MVSQICKSTLNDLLREGAMRVSYLQLNNYNLSGKYARVLVSLTLQEENWI